MEKRVFGTTPQGQEASIYTISAGSISAEILDFGAALYAFKRPDKSGKLVDMILAPATLEQFVDGGRYFDVVCGRYANRISDARFELNGKVYELVKNNGKNHLHGGLTGFSRRVWTVKEHTESSITLGHFSPDGEDGYPGDLDTSITYTVREDGSLELYYEAKAGGDTIVNLTNHAFFNVAGHDHGTINDLLLRVDAQQYIPTDDGGIPLESFAPVEGSPYDFRTPKAVGLEIEADHEQIRFGGGYDQCFVIDGKPVGELYGLPVRECAALYSDVTGITMTVITSEPGVQLYTANGIGGDAGKDGAVYARRGGLCLEAANFPNAVNRPDYPKAVLRAGEVYRQATCYRFEVK